MWETNLGFICAPISVSVARDDLIKIGLGEHINQRAAVIALLAFLSFGSTTCGTYGTREHNKFCLLAFFLTMLLCGGLTFILTGMTETQLEPWYNSTWQELCSSQTGKNEAECAIYLNDERRNKLRELWYTLFTGARDDVPNIPYWTKIMENIQSNGLCCGFDPPYACSFGKNMKGSPISNDAKPNHCGFFDGWYAQTFNCAIQDIQNGKIVDAGCPYSRPGGSCVDFKYDSGCARSTQIWVHGRVLPKFEAIRILALNNIICSFFSFCFMMKRKDTDVLPTTFVKHQMHKERRLEKYKKKKQARENMS